MAMELVSTVTVGSGGAASIEFTNIPQTGKDFLLLVSARTDRVAVNDAIYASFNSSTSNFSARFLQGTGSSVQAGTETRFIGYATGNDATANTFGNTAAYISNYAVSQAKSISTDGVTETNASTAFQAIIAQLWNDTSAITSIAITPAIGPNFLQYSTASLYIIS